MDIEKNLIWAVVYFGISLILYLWAVSAHHDFRMRNKLSSKKFMKRRCEYLWGEEIYWSDNERYIAKEVYIRKGNLLGKRYHKESVKTIMVLSGGLRINAERGGESHDIILHLGEAYEIYPGTRYSILALDGSRYIEISSYSINDNHLCNREKYDRQGHRNLSREND